MLTKSQRLARWGEWAQMLVTRATPGAVNKAIVGLNEQTGSAGGYLVPQELVVGLDEWLEEADVFHRHGMRVPMTTRTCDFAQFDLAVSHAAGTSPLFGGMTLAWEPEGYSITESEPEFDRGRLTAWNLQAVLKISNPLVQDGGPMLGAYLENGFRRIIQWSVERACLQGDGVGEPLGILNAPGTVSVTRQTAGTVTQTDLASMVGSLLPAAFRNAVWMVSVTALAKITALAAYYFNGVAGSDRAGEPSFAGHLFTRPVYVTENLPAVGSSGDVVLFMPGLYALGTRGVEVAASPDPLFQNNQTLFRLVWRGDGQPVVRGTVTLADGSTVVGGYVKLV